MPITFPPDISGPPESPGWSPASVSIRPDSRSAPPWSSPTSIDLPSPVIRPWAEARLPVPPALPTAVTTWPTTRVEVESADVFRFAAPLA